MAAAVIVGLLRTFPPVILPPPFLARQTVMHNRLLHAAAVAVVLAVGSHANADDHVYFPGTEPMFYPRRDIPATVAPSFKDGVLTIPRIDTPERVARFQDVSFRLSEGGSWQLVGGRSVGDEGGISLYVESVALRKIATVPVQVVLVVRASLSDGCTGLGQVSQRRDGSQFTVVIDSVNLAPPDMACTMSVIPFETIIPLPVFGLKAGNYGYDVNGIKGSFELTVDNDLPSAAQ